MWHDFDKKHGGTGNYWDSTNACNKQGIMSYGDWDALGKLGWSTCSVDDFKQHYQERCWGKGCLAEVDWGIYLPIYLSNSVFLQFTIYDLKIDAFVYR